MKTVIRTIQADGQCRWRWFGQPTEGNHELEQLPSQQYYQREQHQHQANNMNHYGQHKENQRLMASEARQATSNGPINKGNKEFPPRGIVPASASYDLRQTNEATVPHRIPASVVTNTRQKSQNQKAEQSSIPRQYIETPEYMYTVGIPEPIEVAGYDIQTYPTPYYGEFYDQPVVYVDSQPWVYSDGPYQYRDIGQARIGRDDPTRHYIPVDPYVSEWVHDATRRTNSSLYD